MPFTPFHMGPGLATKATLGRHFSLPLYGFMQVAIDSEVLAAYPLRRDLASHKILHTFAGATAVAALSVLLLGPGLGSGVRWWNQSTKAAPRVAAGERDGASDRIDGNRTHERSGIGGAADGDNINQERLIHRADEDRHRKGAKMKCTWNSQCRASWKEHGRISPQLEWAKAKIRNRQSPSK